MRGPGRGDGGAPGITPRRWVLLVAALLLAGGCGAEGPRRSGDPALEVRVGFSPTPPMAGEAGVRVVARDDGAPLDPAATVRVRVGPAGGAASAASPAWDTLAFAGEGAWTGTVRFPAAGAVSLIVQVRAGDGREARFVRPVTVSTTPEAPAPGGVPGSQGRGGGHERDVNRP